MMTFVNVTIAQWHLRPPSVLVDAVGGSVFTDRIEQSFEQRVRRMMWKVLL
jgi:hypothetical protein